MRTCIAAVRRTATSVVALLLLTFAGACSARSDVAVPGGSRAGAAPPGRVAPAGQHGIALPSWNVGDYSSRQAPAYVAALARTGASVLI